MGLKNNNKIIIKLALMMEIIIHDCPGKSFRYSPQVSTHDTVSKQHYISATDQTPSGQR